MEASNGYLLNSPALNVGSFVAAVDPSSWQGFINTSLGRTLTTPGYNVTTFATLTAVN
jgi:hypothetical protein